MNLIGSVIGNQYDIGTSWSIGYSIITYSYNVYMAVYWNNVYYIVEYSWQYHNFTSYQVNTSNGILVLAHDLSNK